MQVEVDEQVPLEQARGLVADAATAPARVDCEAPGLGDPVALVDEPEAERADALAVRLRSRSARTPAARARERSISSSSVVARQLARQPEERPRLVVE